MDLQGASASGTSGASLELASLKLAKSQQEQEGKAVARGLLRVQNHHGWRMMQKK